MSGTTIRRAMANLNKDNFEEIMGWYDEEIFNMLKKKMSPEEVEKQDDISVAIMEMIEEVYSEKQRRWACAQLSPGFKGKKSLTRAEAEEMCSGPMLKKKKVDEISSMAGGSVAGYSSPFPGIRVRFKKKEKKDTNYTKNSERFPYEQ